ncbi:MAG: SDR family oxidoreductase [Gammaproteobacteria bacterium]|nr:SDR family oxidoreductase [Gammaproteobacteria bacterium]
MENSLNLCGRNILVTGATSGIGRETAILLSNLGARLVLVGRREDELVKTTKLLKKGDHIIEPFDLNDLNRIQEWVKKIANNVGSLHGIVHSAGLFLIKPVRFLSIDDIHALFSVNVYAAIALTKAFRQKGVVDLKGGNIVLLSSVAGILGDSGLSAYAATKGALIAFTKSAAIELSKDNIRINCVAPAMVKTNMTDNMASLLTPNQQDKQVNKSILGMGSPLDVANAIAFLLSNGARWITGSVLVVDGGYTAH